MYKSSIFSEDLYSSNDNIYLSSDSGIKSEILSVPTIKGQKSMLKMNQHEINTILKSLRENSNIKIRKLKGKLSQQFKQLISYVSLLHDTPSYHYLFSKIDRYFGDLKETQPGTIGAYCIGCRLNNNLPSSLKKCTPSCIGSIPLPLLSYNNNDSKNLYISDLTQCSYLCIWAEFENNKYNITLLNNNYSNNDISYIFVNCDNYRLFRGFTESEKKQLRSWNIDKIMLYGYKKNGREYICLLENPISLNSIKSRISTMIFDQDLNKKLYNDNNILKNNIFMNPYMVGIVIIIIAIFISYFYWIYNNNKNNKK